MFLQYVITFTLEIGVTSSSSTIAHALATPFVLPVYTFSAFPSVKTEGSLPSLLSTVTGLPKETFSDLIDIIFGAS